MTQPLLSPREAYDSLGSGLVLIDVRTPEEWAQTGLPQGGHGICLSDPALFEKIEGVALQKKQTPLAIICAAGGRSARVQQALLSQGYEVVYNISEGMMGAQGWLDLQLPVTPYSPSLSEL